MTNPNQLTAAIGQVATLFREANNLYYARQQQLQQQSLIDANQKAMIPAPTDKTPSTCTMQ